LIMPITSEQITAARALLRVGQAELAQRADISVVTIRRIESPARIAQVAPETLATVQRALEAAGAEFIEGGVRRCSAPDRAALLARLQLIVQRSVARQQDQRSVARQHKTAMMSEADLYDESGLPA
jgi:transcriptional regulator with XRE-family HTH domain